MKINLIELDILQDSLKTDIEYYTFDNKEDCQNTLQGYIEKIEDIKEDIEKTFKDDFEAIELKYILKILGLRGVNGTDASIIKCINIGYAINFNTNYFLRCYKDTESENNYFYYLDSFDFDDLKDQATKLKKELSSFADIQNWDEYLVNDNILNIFSDLSSYTDVFGFQPIEFFGSEVALLKQIFSID